MGAPHQLNNQRAFTRYAPISTPFTLTLTLSHQGRGDSEPHIRLDHPHPDPLPPRERGDSSLHSE